MGRAAIRTAIAAYLATPAIPFVGTVHRARPKLIPPTDFTIESELDNSGAVIVVHLPHDLETRTAAGGKTSGGKWDKSTVVLELLFQSPVGAQQAQDDHDAFIDALMMRLRADRQLGAPSVIFQSGQDPTGYDLQLAEPITGAQTVIISAALTFSVWSYIVA